MVSIFKVYSNRNLMNIIGFFFCRAGLNILLHGVGSKKSLISLFFQKYLKNHFLTFIINGFLPNTTIKQVQILLNFPINDSLFRFCKLSVHVRRLILIPRIIMKNVYRILLNELKKKVIDLNLCFEKK